MDSTKVPPSSGARAQGLRATPAHARPGRLVPARSDAAREGSDDRVGRTSSGLDAITVTTADDRVTYRRGQNANHIWPLPDALHIWLTNWDHVAYPWDEIVALDAAPEPTPISPRHPRIASIVDRIGRGTR